MDGGAWWAAVHGVARSRTRLSDFTFMHWRRKWQPTPVFLPGESQGRGSLVGCRLWGRTESDTTEVTAAGTVGETIEAAQHTRSLAYCLGGEMRRGQEIFQQQYKIICAQMSKEMQQTEEVLLGGLR